ncbi:hypothetical protein PV11_09086 [Exophiala sideris]|uniref:CCHC-type domain-containing protein n=1 Tax=Exophiala sideris TaxID=1016849 RepID=A0A0D1VMQ7_9EURO|nr:hypothetical protein PV11_09086 [Exophiala sideris]
MLGNAGASDEEGESRTASIGLRRTRLNRQGQVNETSFVPHLAPQPQSSSAVMGNSASHAAADPNSLNQTQVSTSNVPSTLAATMPPHPSPGFGKNRLAVGFRKPTAPVSQDPAGNESATSATGASPGVSADDAIEISSDEEDDSSEGGGMVINLEHDTPENDHEHMVIDTDEEEHREVIRHAAGQVSKNHDTSRSSASADQAVDMQLQAEISQSATGRSNPFTAIEPPESHPVLRLADLTQDELDLQLKYALFDVDSDQIDLTWPAICLACLKPGHSEGVCPEKQCVHCAAVGQHSSRLCPLIGRCSKCRERGHTVESCNADLKVTTVPCDLCGGLNHVEASCPGRFFPANTETVASSHELWISCCVCASKSHLVGDCPDTNSTAKARWSLKLFTAGQVTNLSLEAGTKQRELEAANRGLRPEGMRIKGRAGLHNAGTSRSKQPSDDETDNQFFGPRVTKRGNDNRANFTFRQPHALPDRPPVAAHGDRYDRYNAPSDMRAAPVRSRNDWYATDSFGRRRSRSPGRSDESRDVRQRSSGPSPYNSHPSANSKTVDVPRDSQRRGETDRSSQGVSIQLPLRRGSNPISNKHAMSDQAPISGQPAQQPKVVTGKGRKPRQKKSKKNGANAQRQA